MALVETKYFHISAIFLFAITTAHTYYQFETEVVYM